MAGFEGAPLRRGGCPWRYRRVDGPGADCRRGLGLEGPLAMVAAAAAAAVAGLYFQSMRGSAVFGVFRHFTCLLGISIRNKITRRASTQRWALWLSKP